MPSKIVRVVIITVKRIKGFHFKLFPNVDCRCMAVEGKSRSLGKSNKTFIWTNVWKETNDECMENCPSIMLCVYECTRIGLQYLYNAPRKSWSWQWIFKERNSHVRRTMFWKQLFGELKEFPSFINIRATITYSIKQAWACMTLLTHFDSSHSSPRSTMNARMLMLHH